MVDNLFLCVVYCLVFVSALVYRYTRTEPSFGRHYTQAELNIPIFMVFDFEVLPSEDLKFAVKRALDSHLMMS